MEYFTNIEQSKKLLGLGLNQNSADMVYLKYADSDNLTPRFEGANPMVLGDIPIDEIGCETLPCWSIGKLLDLMNYPKLYKDKFGDDDAWICEAFVEQMGETFQGPAMEKQIDACVETIQWLLEKKIIKNDT